MPTAEINPNFSGFQFCLQQNCICPSSNHPSQVILAVKWFSPGWLKAPSSFHIAALPSSVVVQSLSHVWLFVIPWTAGHQASLSITISLRLLKFMSIELIMPSNHLIFCCPLLLLPSIFLSIRVFANELDLHISWPKYWSFSFSISSSNEYLGLIPFKKGKSIDRFDLLAIQGTLKSLLQHHNLKASILQHQPSLRSNSHIHIWLLEKTIGLTRRTFVSKVMSLLFKSCLGLSQFFFQGASIF